MFYLVLSLCAVTVTFFVSRYLVLKARLVEKNINEVIARKLLESKHTEELNRHREDISVMRNLLIDMVENEASLAGVDENTPAEERARRFNARTVRRRELFGEALAVLQKAKAKPLRIPSPVQSD